MMMVTWCWCTAGRAVEGESEDCGGTSSLEDPSPPTHQESRTGGVTPHLLGAAGGSSTEPTQVQVQCWLTSIAVSPGHHRWIHVVSGEDIRTAGEVRGGGRPLGARWGCRDAITAGHRGGQVASLFQIRLTDSQSCLMLTKVDLTCNLETFIFTDVFTTSCCRHAAQCGLYLWCGIDDDGMVQCWWCGWWCLEPGGMIPSPARHGKWVRRGHMRCSRLQLAWGQPGTMWGPQPGQVRLTAQHTQGWWWPSDLGCHPEQVAAGSR